MWKLKVKKLELFLLCWKETKRKDLFEHVEKQNKIFLLGFLMHIRYNYSIENWVWQCWRVSGWGSNSRPSVLAAFNCILTGAWPPRLASPIRLAIMRPGRWDPSFSNHPTVLASQVAWITGESQFSRPNSRRFYFCFYLWIFTKKYSSLNTFKLERLSKNVYEFLCSTTLLRVESPFYMQIWHF